MTPTVTVSNSTELLAALQAATAATQPEIIALAPGLYAPVDAWNIQPAQQITVESANPQRQATLQGLEISQSSNVTFNDLTFSNGLNDSSSSSVAWSLHNHGVDFTNDTFAGAPGVTLANSANYGLEVEDSTSTTVSGSTFSHLHNGLAMLGDTGVVVTYDAFSSLYDDGVDSGGSSDVTITSNQFTDLHPDESDTGHPDCIQFWTAGEPTGGSNILIANNKYARGAGDGVQGIFFQSETSGEGFSNVTIRNNNFEGSAWNAIYLNAVTGLDATGNIMRSYTEPVYNPANIAAAPVPETAQLVLDGVSGRVADNLYGALSEQGTNDVTLSGNAIIPAVTAPAATQAALMVSAMASFAPSASAVGGAPEATAATAGAQVLAAPGH